MAKADLVLTDGTTVVIEGTAEEVALLLLRVSSASVDSLGGASRQEPEKAPPAKTIARPRRQGPQQLIADLARERWFSSKRTIGDVQKKLEEKGHIYAMESLSTPLLRLTRNRTLRRIKDKDGWVYVG